MSDLTDEVLKGLIAELGDDTFAGIIRTVNFKVPTMRAVLSELLARRASTDAADPAYTDGGRFYYVPMPVNADGHGPEMDPAKVRWTQHEIWNELHLSIGTFASEEVAKWVADALNAQTSTTDAAPVAVKGLHFIVGKMSDDEWHHLAGPARMDILERVLPGWQERTPSACIVTALFPAPRSEVREALELAIMAFMDIATFNPSGADREPFEAIAIHARSTTLEVLPRLCLARKALSVSP